MTPADEELGTALVLNFRWRWRAGMLAVFATLPGWSDGPSYAPHPLVLRG